MRINNAHKETAKRYIKNNVLDEESLKEVQFTEKIIIPWMVEQITDMYYQPDMAILEKYGHASRIRNIQLENIRDELYRNPIITLPSDVTVKIPSRYSGEHSTWVVSSIYFDSRLKKDIDIFCTAWKKHRALSKAMQDKYNKLLESCTTFKQLAEFWPECVKVFPNCLDKKNTALICISKEDLKFIKQDSLKRLQKEKE